MLHFNQIVPLTKGNVKLILPPQNNRAQCAVELIGANTIDWDNSNDDYNKRIQVSHYEL